MGIDAKTQTFSKTFSGNAFSVAVFFAGLLLFAVLALVWSSKANAVPAPIDRFEVTQPDGSSFVARQYGDEWNNGVETIAGYTVVKDAGVWEYAEKAANGGLVPSGEIVTKDAPPEVPKHLRSELPSDLRPSDPDSAFAPPPPEESPSGEATNAPSSEESTMASLSSPSIGTQKSLVILASFPNQPPLGSTPAQWSTKFFGANNSVKDYYNEVSYGKLNIAPATESHGTANNGVVGWVRLSMNHPDTNTDPDEMNRLISRNAILAANRYVNYGAYDTNRDGLITAKELHVTVIVAGEEAALCDGKPCARNSVWGHRFYLVDNRLQEAGVKAPTVDGVQVGQYTKGGGYTQFGEWHKTRMATLGIMVHEIGHDLGLPDLYDTTPRHAADSRGVGLWSVMGAGSWLGLNVNDGTMPSHPDAFSKSYEGWLAPIRVAGTNVAKSIAHSAMYAAAFQLRDNPNGVDWTWSDTGYPTRGTGEYFLVENRQRVGYDRALPGCGLLVWHIDESVTYDNYANSDENHKLVDLEEADGLNELDTMQSFGDQGDPFTSTGGGRTTFNGATNPNSMLYNNTGSGVAMSNASACDTTMSANFTAPGAATNTAPTGTIKINAGAAATRNLQNKLTLSATDADGVAQMRFHNDSGTWTAWEPYATTKWWNLRNAQGIRTVYVQYKDKKGNVSGETAIKDTIEYDTVSPSITAITPAPGSHKVPLDASVKITFSDDMNASTVTTNNIFIRRLNKDGTYGAINSAVTYYASSRTAVLNPVNNLSAGATYVVSVLGGPEGGGVKDTAYNELDQDSGTPGTQGHFWRLYTW
jgi:M6 family metalloprotease-like protein